jgi:ribose 1,5-bisphosphokinase PhnN
MSRFVLAITGPTGSGKSAIAQRVAKSLKSCVNIDADHIKHMIVSGFYKDESNAGGWSFNQWGLVGDSIGLLADNFIDEGYDVIINGFLDNEAWESLEKRISITHKVLLLPSVEVTADRDSKRPEDFVMGKDAIEQHHSYLTNDDFYSSFHKLDTSDQTLDETILAIKKLLPPA